jgi:hypothetical protein
MDCSAESGRPLILPFEFAPPRGIVNGINEIVEWGSLKYAFSVCPALVLMFITLTWLRIWRCAFVLFRFCFAQCRSYRLEAVLLGNSHHFGALVWVASEERWWVARLLLVLYPLTGTFRHAYDGKAPEPFATVYGDWKEACKKAFQGIFQGFQIEVALYVRIDP